MKLELSNVTKSFQDKVIFNNFSHLFNNTGICLIKGESGIGKTTLLRMIAGLDNKYQGTINNGGIDNVSFMFQEYRLFPTLTALQNASVSANCISEYDASDLLMQLGFDTADLKKMPHELSGGMKQRVSFVRALIKKSPILILDEPTKELDTNTAQIMLDMIRTESQKRLVILVTHDDICKNEDVSDYISL